MFLDDWLEADRQPVSVAEPTLLAVLSNFAASALLSGLWLLVQCSQQLEQVILCSNPNSPEAPRSAISSSEVITRLIPFVSNQAGYAIESYSSDWCVSAHRNLAGMNDTH